MRCSRAKLGLFCAPAGRWAQTPTLAKLAAKARITTDTKARQTIYRRIQRRLNQTGAFFPLLQPTQVFVSTKDLRNAAFNAQVDVTQVAPR
jgi:ABC-type transport system substrate-binding protein